MTTVFRITAGLLSSIRVDLARPHPFAYERVGFIAAAPARSADGILLLARDYRPVADEDYLRDRSVGAMMGPEALRKALEWALLSKVAIFHVHSHGGIDAPAFSRTDLRETARFIPDFLKVCPQNPHGAIVLSNDAAVGRVWISRDRSSVLLSAVVEVGRPLRKRRNDTAA